MPAGLFSEKSAPLFPAFRPLLSLFGCLSCFFLLAFNILPANIYCGLVTLLLYKLLGLLPEPRNFFYVPGLGLMVPVLLELEFIVQIIDLFGLSLFFIVTGIPHPVAVEIVKQSHVIGARIEQEKVGGAIL